MDKKNKIKKDYLDSIYERNLVFGNDAPFGYLYFNKSKENDRYIITGYDNKYCSKKIFIDGIFTEIGDGAFKDNDIIEEIVLGFGIKKIGKEAFMNCTSLKKVICRQSLRTLSSCAFKGCSSLEKIQLGGFVEKIEDNCFEDCSSLKNIHLGVNLYVLGKGVFKNCINLRHVYVYANIYILPEELFYNCKNLKEFHCEKILKILDNCFQNSGIEKLYVSSHLRHVGYSCFADCYNFKYVIFKNFSLKQGFNILVCGNNKLFSDAIWIGDFENGHSLVIERKNSV